MSDFNVKEAEAALQTARRNLATAQGTIAAEERSYNSLLTNLEGMGVDVSNPDKIDVSSQIKALDEEINTLGAKVTEDLLAANKLADELTQELEDARAG